MRVVIDHYVERDAAGALASLLEDEPAIMVEGPRGSGKSTLLRQITTSRGGRILDLDDPATADLVALDPAGALEGPGLVFIDEYQRVPDILSVVKREVDRDPRPGRFVLAGSVSGRLLPLGTETLTGRVHRIALHPLSVGEIVTGPARLIPHLLEGGEPQLLESPLTRRDYFDLVSAGGYPAALRRHGTAARRRWLASYLATVADRDLPGLVDIRHPGALTRLYRLVAERSGSVMALTTLGESLGIHPATARAYLDLLERVHLALVLPGWTAGVSAKVARRPRVHLTDTGLATVALGLDATRLAASPAGGGLLETFVLSEMVKQSVAVDEPMVMAHFRDRSGVEVDAVIELPGGEVFAFEVKSATSVATRDARGLAFLRDRLGARFQAGILLHTGPRSARLDRALWALPISTLWGGT